MLVAKLYYNADKLKTIYGLLVIKNRKPSQPLATISSLLAACCSTLAETLNSRVMLAKAATR